MISTPATISPREAVSHDEDLRQEAARYALMRRLAPALRHHLAGEFQPISIMAALIERQAKQAGCAELLTEHAISLGQLSKKAAARCMTLIHWIVPTAEESVDLHEAIDECLEMVRTGLRLQGIEVIHHPHEMALRVAASATRTVLPAAVLHLADHTPGPAQLHLRVHKRGRKAWIDIETEATLEARSQETNARYRLLQWGDVKALAQAERVGLETLEQGLRLQLNASPGESPADRHLKHPRAQA